MAQSCEKSFSVGKVPCFVGGIVWMTTKKKELFFLCIPFVGSGKQQSEFLMGISFPMRQIAARKCWTTVNCTQDIFDFLQQPCNSEHHQWVSHCCSLNSRFVSFESFPLPKKLYLLSDLEKYRTVNTSSKSVTPQLRVTTDSLIQYNWLASNLWRRNRVSEQEKEIPNPCFLWAIQ